jgi:hypothetical protein
MTQQINPITGRQYAARYNPGNVRGALMFGSRRSKSGDLILTASVKSYRREDRYLIEANTRTGDLRCSCTACAIETARRGTYPNIADADRAGYCKHLRDWWQELARELIERNAEVQR